MNIADIIKRLPSEPGKPTLISGILIEVHQNLDSSRSEPTIIVLTDRTLTRNGGNGRDGLDGIDMNNIRYALRSALGEDRRSGFIPRYIVRERRTYPPGQYDKI